MENKMKASELFLQLVINTRRTTTLKDKNIVKFTKERMGPTNKNIEGILKDIDEINEYVRFSTIKTTIKTLIELDMVEDDIEDMRVLENIWEGQKNK